VHVFPPTFIDAGSDLILDIGDQPVLNPVLPGNGTFFWSPATGLSCTDCPNPVATPDFNQWYVLTFTDDYGCTYTDSLLILVTPSVFIPNAFTPNADAHNNIFYPVVRNLATMEFWIFNRWGQIVFHTTDPSEGWNGTHKNIPCPNDVYVWKIKYTDYIEPDVEKVKIGHVTLVR
jgi:gliding motility-associated-like protein